MSTGRLFVKPDSSAEPEIFVKPDLLFLKQQEIARVARAEKAAMSRDDRPPDMIVAPCEGALHATVNADATVDADAAVAGGGGGGGGGGDKKGNKASNSSRQLTLRSYEAL